MATKKTNVKSKMSNKKPNSPKQNSPSNVRTGEIVAICLIALGIFFGISVYSHNGGFLGEAISNVLLGLFGYCAYLLPVIMIAAIICYLFFSGKKNMKVKMILNSCLQKLLMMLYVMVVLHL